MKKLSSILTTGLAAVAMLVACSSVQADTFVQDFTNGGNFTGNYGGPAWTNTEVAGGVQVTGGFDGGVFDTLVPGEGATEGYGINDNILLTLQLGTANTATAIRLILQENDGLGANTTLDSDTWGYDVDLTQFSTSGFTTVNLGTLADWAIEGDGFGRDPGDGIVNIDAGLNTGLYEWQLQGFVAGQEGLNVDIIVQSLQIKPAGAVPEPGSLAVLGLGALGLVARRRRS